MLANPFSDYFIKWGVMSDGTRLLHSLTVYGMKEYILVKRTPGNGFSGNIPDTSDSKLVGNSYVCNGCDKVFKTSVLFPFSYI